jgi:hypothetical protein
MSDRVTDVISALLEFKPSDDEIENVDTLYEIFDGFGDFPDGARAVPAMLSILERYPKAEFGNPGPIVHELEKIDDRVALRESLHRQPTVPTVWMINRILNSKISESEREMWVSELKRVKTHPLAFAALRAASDRYLQYQGIQT